ncbi:MAG: hypothetical protein KAH32_04855 [Chlamydiia bacterium]|nr:hypothetical protein [Chlamydiia bacterium]
MEIVESVKTKKAKKSTKKIGPIATKVWKTAKETVVTFSGAKAVIPELTMMGGNVLVTTLPPKTKLITTSDMMATQQTVLAVGPHVTQLKVGDWVEINTEMFPKSKKPGPHDLGNTITVHPPIETINNVKYLLITERHIKFIFNTHEI